MNDFPGIKRFIGIVSRTCCLASSTFRAGEEIKEILPGELDYLRGAKGKAFFEHHPWNSSYKRETSEETVWDSSQNVEVFAVGKIVYEKEKNKCMNPPEDAGKQVSGVRCGSAKKTHKSMGNRHP